MIKLALDRALYSVLLGGWLACLPLSAVDGAEKAPLATTPLDQIRDYQDALQASERAVVYNSDSLFEVAGVKYERVLKDSKLKLSDADRKHVTVLLVEAWLRSTQPQKAKDFLDLNQDLEERLYWLAQAYLGLHQYEQAELSISEYLKLGGKLQPYAKLTLGKALVGQGKDHQAKEVFRELTSNPSTSIAEAAQQYWNETEIATGRAAEVISRLGEEVLDPDLEFLRAEALLVIGEARKAEKTLLRLRDIKESLPKDLMDAIQLRLVQADALQNDFKGAGKRLLKFLNQDEDTQFIEQAFELFNLYVSRTEIDPIESLSEWAAISDPPARQQLALWNLSQWQLSQGRQDLAAEALETLRSLYPQESIQSKVVPQLISLYGDMGEDAKVLSLAAQWRLQPGTGQAMGVDFLTASVQFKRGEYEAAAQLFEKASLLAKNVYQQRLALYNVALSQLLSGHDEAFAKQVQALKSTEKEGDGSEVTSLNLELEKVLKALRDLAPDAVEQANHFLKQHSNLPRIGDLYIGLAEHYIRKVSPQPEKALEVLTRIPESVRLDEAQMQKRDFFALWASDLSKHSVEVIRIGQEFVEKWPDAKEKEMILLKVAQAYYQVQDYAKAETAFEQIAENYSESPYAEIALFFAAKSAINLQSPAGVERAWTFWTELIAMKGELAFDARREQVQIRRRQMKFEEALTILEDLITNYPQITAEERWSLLIEKGENLALLARETPSKFADAVQVFDGMARDESIPRGWRSRAGVLLSQLYLQSGQKAEALEACYDVVTRYMRDGDKQDELSPLDYTWLYRAGFNALDMLEEKKQWGAAAELADRLAAFGGDRSEMAKQRSERIRLEHFIWKKE